MEDDQKETRITKRKKRKRGETRIKMIKGEKDTQWREKINIKIKETGEKGDKEGKRKTQWGDKKENDI